MTNHGQEVAKSFDNHLIIMVDGVRSATFRTSIQHTSEN